jgi:hypothetical protein
MKPRKKKGDEQTNLPVPEHHLKEGTIPPIDG